MALEEPSPALVDGGGDRQWAIAIVASREEAAVLLRTLTAAADAEGPARWIDVVVNGNAKLAASLSVQLQHSPAPTRNTRVWSIPRERIAYTTTPMFDH